MHVHLFVWADETCMLDFEELMSAAGPLSLCHLLYVFQLIIIKNLFL